MDYKEKYYTAIENIKKIKAANKDNKELVDFIEYQYPELKETEDEKIRKGIITYLEQSQFGEEHYQIDDDIVRNYIAWLEKQDEQKTTKWSEEDERILNATIKTILISRGSCEEDDEVKDRFDDEIRWLESIKQRMKGK